MAGRRYSGSAHPDWDIPLNGGTWRATFKEPIIQVDGDFSSLQKK